MEDSFQEIDDLLHSWNLPQLCQVFRDQEINIDTLEALTDADIVELIPKVGPRALFRKRLTEWLNTTELVPTAEEELIETVIENNDAQYFELETIEESENNATEIYLPNELAISNEVEIDNKIWTENITQDNATEQITTNETTEYVNIDFLDEVMEEEQASKQLNKLKNTKQIQRMKQSKQIKKKTEIIKSNDDIEEEETIDVIKIEAVKEIPSSKTFHAEAEIQRYLNVEEVLLNSEGGRTIIENYQLNPHINKKTRLFIGDLIISEVFAKNLVLDRAKFEDLAQQVIEIFPNEDINAWYTAQRGNSRNSGGTLYNKYYTVYRKMRKTGFYEHYVDGVIKYSHSFMETDNNHCMIPEEIDDEPDKLAFKRAIPRYERLRRCCDFERIHVRNLLESSFEGRSVIEIYNKYETFDIQTRNRLCKLVVMEAIRRNIKMRPRDFYDISCQIVELFPSETVDKYFLPRGRTPPKGCLYHKYLYIKRRLRRNGTLKKANAKL